MSRAFVLLLLQVSAVAHAGEGSLMKATSLSALEDAVARNFMLEDAKSRCRFELETTALPRGCFLALDIELKGLLIRSGEVERQRAWLDKLCVKRARGAANIDSLRDLSSLSTNCRTVALERRADLEYRLEEENPTRLFEGRADAE